MVLMDTRLRRQLAELEAELRRMGYWSAEPPDASALHSRQPFCYDTLLLQEWLQWVFIPKMHTLLDEGRSLPANCDIFPYAEEALKGVTQDVGPLLGLLEVLDKTLNEPHSIH